MPSCALILRLQCVVELIWSDIILVRISRIWLDGNLIIRFSCFGEMSIRTGSSCFGWIRVLILLMDQSADFTDGSEC